MPAPIHYYSAAPAPYFGSWSIVGGVPRQELYADPNSPDYKRPEFITWGAEPYQSTVGNSTSCTTNLPFVPLLFMDGPGADAILGAGSLSASSRLYSGYSSWA